MCQRFAEISEDSRADIAQEAGLARSLKELSDALERLKKTQEEFARRNDALSLDYQKLDKENRRYQGLFEFAPLPCLITDAKGKILDANRAAALLLNTREKFLIAKPLRTYVERETRSDFLPLLDMLREQGQLSAQRLRLKPRGRDPVAVSVSASARYFEEVRSNAKILELQWVIQDLTEQERGGEALRESEEKYRSLIENAQEGIYRATHDGRFTAANPSFARMLGYDSPDKLLNTRASELYADPGECSRLLNEVEKAPVSGREVRLRKKAGEAMVASLSMRVIRDKDGCVLAYEGLVQDITERKKMAERLWQHDRLAAVGSTIAVLTHEISNPLNGMFTLVQMIERQLGAAQTQESVLSDYFRDLKLETKRLVDLLSDFRLFAQVQYTFAALSLHELIDEVLSLEKVNYADSGVRIRVELAENIPLIEGDKSKLKQALLNLCKNAIEAMAGEGLLTIKGENTDTHVILEISDTGPRIPEELDVFEPFITNKEHGTGLGLPIVRQIVLAHGGTVVCSSNAGKGATFRLVLPIRQRSGGV